MAERDEVAHTTTESLIYKQPRKRFVAKLAPEHWQLRSLLCTDNDGNIYHPGGAKNRQISKLNIQTRSYEHVRTLTFAPKCLAGKNGYVCVGGEQGELVIVSPRVPTPLRRTLSGTEVNHQIAHSLERRWSREDFEGRGDDDVRRNATSILGDDLVYKSKQVGDLRINCITLWFPPVKQLDVASVRYQKPVAVLATNDMHVTIVDLESQDVIETLKYPDCVNRAVLSPDGRLLVAICDDPYLYVRERMSLLVHSATALSESKTSTGAECETTQAATALFEYEWRNHERVPLRSQKKDDRTDNKGSFAACFSHTGDYLAVGTQYGTISIFNVAALTDPNIDPLLSSFQTTRPRTKEGAVRDMAFCPGPFDLLAWSEHADSIGVADIRRGCVSWQILSIKDSSDFDVQEVGDDATIDPRLLQSNVGRAPTTVVPVPAARDARSIYEADTMWHAHMEQVTSHLTRATNLQSNIYHELDGLRDSQTSRRGHEEEMADMLENARAGLNDLDRHLSNQLNGFPVSQPQQAHQTRTTDLERQEIALRARARNEVPGHSSDAVSRGTSGTPRQTSGEFIEALRRQRQRLLDMSTNGARALSRRADLQSQAQARAYAEAAPTGNRSHGIRPSSYRSSAGTPNGTSLSSVRVQNTDNNTASGSASQARDALSTTTSTTASTSRPSRRTGGWADLHALEAVADWVPADTETLPIPGSGRDLQQQRQRTATALLDTLTTSESPLDPSGTDHDRAARPTAPLLFSSNTPSSADLGHRAISLAMDRAVRLRQRQAELHGTETAGLVWSDDGEKLYVAAQNGVYEFQVNTYARRQYPDITLR